MDTSFSESFDQFPFLDAESVLNAQEVREIDEAVYSVIYSKAVAQKIFPTKSIRKGSRTYNFTIANAPSMPRFSKDFIDETFEKITKTETAVNLVGIHLDYFISMVDIDASRTSPYHKDKIDTMHIREITAKVADVKENILWRGYDVYGANPGAIDSSLKGFCNHASVQTFLSGAGADADMSASGDGPFSVGTAAQTLLNYFYEPPFHCVLSPMLYGRLCVNFNTTTHLTDIERMQSMVDKDGRKMLAAIHVTPHIIKSADRPETAVTASCMVLIAPKTNAGEPTGIIVESYPMGHYPITATKLGIRGKILWMGAPVLLRPTAVTIDEDMDLTV